ncbi:MAG: glycosyltransferase [Tannerellaceae bacterium]|jgi:glycosyltransferase involved in cell wall biosynthesis|nr:glycosyltransferase [Tannerellaceae bacterium]
MNPPLISIITAVYNGVSTLEATILSVINQTYKNIEYIIIDGGSSDGTINIIEKYENKITYWVSEPDKGIYDAWNKGLKIASGEWICFVGSDDILYPYHAKTYIDYIRSLDQRRDYIYAKVDIVDIHGNYIRYNIGKPYEWNSFKKRMQNIHVGSMHSSEYFRQYGFFDTQYKIIGDYEILLRAKNKLKVGFINKTTLKMSLGGISSNIKTLLNESEMAKIKTAGRNKFICFIEKYWYYLRIFLMKLVYGY